MITTLTAVSNNAVNGTIDLDMEEVRLWAESEKTSETNILAFNLLHELTHICSGEKMTEVDVTLLAILMYGEYPWNKLHSKFIYYLCNHEHTVVWRKMYREKYGIDLPNFYLPGNELMLNLSNGVLLARSITKQGEIIYYEIGGFNIDLPFPPCP